MTDEKHKKGTFEKLNFKIGKKFSDGELLSYFEDEQKLKEAFDNNPIVILTVLLERITESAKFRHELIEKLELLEQKTASK